LRGQAEVHYGGYVLYADEMTYNTDTGEATADGHVVLDGGLNDEHIQASHASYNLRTEIGEFRHVVGTIGIKLHGTHPVLTTSNPFTMTGKLVKKTGPDHYVVYDGTVTSCELPTPKWQFNAHRVVVEVGGNASIYRSTFRIKGIPILYLPFATHPVQRIPRQSGFLIPNIGRSSTKGTILGESVFLALSPSMDATVGAEYYSIRGWAQRGEFRARPSETSFADLTYFGVLDRGFGHPKTDQGGEEARLDGEKDFARNFRGVANIDYLSSFVFRLAFYDTFSLAVNSEVKSQAFLSNTSNGFSYNAFAQRYQNFESTTPGDVVTILHAPGFDLSSVDRPIGHTPFNWSYDVGVGGLSRSEPGFRTGNLVGRFDLHPSLSLPLVLRSWSIRPELAVRDTFYSERLTSSSGTATSINDPINRKALETSVEIRPPAVDRVFGREFLGKKWKHVIEPRMVYRYVTGVDNFPNILRFDYRDILSNTNEVEYAVVNRVYAKQVNAKFQNCSKVAMPALMVGGAARRSPVPWETQVEPQNEACQPEPQSREVLSWEIGQKYFFDPTFGGALVPGVRNVFTTTEQLTGIAFLTSPRRFSPIVSRLRVQTTARTDAEWDVDYDLQRGFINASTALANYHVGEFTIGGGDTYLRTPGELVGNPTAPPQRFNQFRLLFGYGHANKRGLSLATSVGFDATLGFLQYGSAQISYNWDCCGATVEYRRFALGSVRNENQFRFTFSLANIGSLGNLRRQERLF
jgi:LPS-assembly protein